MNIQCVFLSLTFIIFVKLKFCEANRLKFKKENPKIDTRSSYHRYHRLDLPQFNYYYNLLNRPFVKRHIFKIHNIKKHFNDVTPFVDLTRDDSLEAAFNFGNVNKFSDDYIDISELARYAKNPIDRKVTNKLKLEPNKKVLIDIHGNTYQVLKILDRIKRRMVPYHLRSKAQSDTDESNGNSESNDQEESSGNTKNNNLKNKARERYIPKRFRIINNNSEEAQSDDNEDGEQKIITFSENSADEDHNRGQANSNSESKSSEESDDYVYIQSPTRHLKTRDVNWRRRLPHFLPKRVHWTEKDIQNLRNYWIAGPRGKYPAQHRTPY